MSAAFCTPILRVSSMLRQGLAIITLAVIFSGINLAHAQHPSLLRWSEGELSVAIEENSAASAKVTIGVGKGSLRAAFAVDNPSRVVLDLQGVRLRKGRALNVAAPALVQALRLGVHQELIRLVIDCSEAVPPSFKVEGKTGMITVYLKASQEAVSPPPEESLLPNATPQTTWPAIPSFSDSSSSSPTVVPSAAPVITEIGKEPATTTVELPPTEVSPLPAEPPLAEPPALVVPTASPTPQATATATSRPTKAPRIPATATAAPKAEQQPTPQGAAISAVPDGTPVIQQVTFEFLSAQRLPTIVVTASKRGEFKLSRADDRTFELLLPRHSLLSPQLALPQFPTDEFMGITFVKPEDSTQGVKIRIGVDHGTRIGAVWQDTRLLITTR